MPYRVEYAKSGKSKCRGVQLVCSSNIAKGALRIGTFFKVGGHDGILWRHWECLTANVLLNVRDEYPDVSAIPGYDSLTAKDKGRLLKAWSTGRLDEEEAEEEVEEEEEEEEDEEDEDEENKKGKGKKRQRKAKISADKASKRSRTSD